MTLLLKGGVIMLVQWLALSSHRKKVVGLIWGTFLCGVCLFSFCLHKFSQGSLTPLHNPKMCI